MTTDTSISATKGNGGLFAMSFAAITATSFCFILRALVIGHWGTEFGLSETQKGELAGVGLWPFAISIVLISLVIDKVGFKLTYWFAAICHVVGLGLLFMADGYWMLYIGTFIMALGNGAVEAAANPLIATVYSHDKPKWLNRLHAGWPGGMILGGLLAMALGYFAPEAGWRVTVGLMIIPILVYTFLLLAQKFPVSERVAHGVSYRTMLGEAGFVSAFILSSLIMLEIGRVFSLPPVATFGAVAVLTLIYAFFARAPGRPLFILLLLLMMPLAVTELATDSWISELMGPEMQKIGLAAGWVLIYTNLIVFVIRIFAGTLIEKFKPLGVLAFASALAAVGIFMMAGATGPAILAAATLYGIGKSFFWGTSMAVASEQFPKAGAVGINMFGGAGMLAAGILGTVLLGATQDSSTREGLKRHDEAQGTALTATYLTQEKVSIFGRYPALDEAKVAAAPDADKAVFTELSVTAKKDALKEMALLPLFTLLVYLGLIFWFRSRGGYKPVVLGEKKDD
ncbi:sugar MFS transporter [Asticcacaulis sp. AC402]|uniref:MFS transporter n=1 Tax=Asticcacaulis sp. AC402 TaxID=1282361 RepID=UPI0003C3F7A2|nr:MFS transporter [Asticcacaulis sp. AC402]ESQ77702.1 MFS transporter [Asticcacaulis sp. AC402]